MPRFVEREMRAFLRCGILEHGFVRVHCDACGYDRLVGFSCKGRGFGPSCRMADTAAFLVDHVLPIAPARQWVLSLPFALRYRLSYDSELAAAVLRLFVRASFASQRRRARKRFGPRAYACGAVTFVQRFGDALNLNLHYHTIVLDGVFVADRTGALRLHALAGPSDRDIECTTRRIARCLRRLLLARGIVFEQKSNGSDELDDEASFLAGLYAASASSRVALGPRAGRGVIRILQAVDPEQAAFFPGPRCANINGVSLHANVCVPARDRRRLERLCRYAARPPLCTGRLSRLDDGRRLYRLKRRWRDGTTHV